MESSPLSRLSNLHRHLHPQDSTSKAKLLYPSSLHFTSNNPSCLTFSFWASDDNYLGWGFLLLFSVLVLTCVQLQDLVKLSAEVSDALSRGHPVVALESTIISHGMPYPKNLETAKEVEAIVRANGAIPATIAILNGVPCVGLSAQELESLATLGTKARKTARRDIAFVVGSPEYIFLPSFIVIVEESWLPNLAVLQIKYSSTWNVATKGNGATTVSATMLLASMVGIPVFVTGGIGGVHRHGEHTMDISSDLTELGKTPVAVISAGVKSILDIPRTLEYLETQGVCVAAYRTDEFPAFFTAKSGCKAPCRVDSPEDCARLVGK
ncbi:hypothetical protein Tsubulata_000782 [Turnera subulata]|uniref:Pseudouridine-5'-phosphate glycosidase n=1 Tax=Turnera subulata TaxID=218843 RepID=A0A9Q0GBI2_9ROSI|nr:hypothetical protein Tsubulata_000782 [Turnera subulata]